jgi:EmrB/QacA subfamily drug resistance transporter
MRGWEYVGAGGPGRRQGRLGNVTKYRGRPWVVLIVVSLGFFMTLLDLTIVNIAIPNMITKLHASLDGILWVINAYALILAVLLITAGRLGDLRGQRKLFIYGVALFTLASAACGFSPTTNWLIGFRAIQGVGAALLMPQTLAILTMVFPPERRGAAFGIWGAVAGVATIAGPTLGGLLVTAFDWRYIFFINVPIGAIVIVLSLLWIPDLRTGQQHRLDIPGVLLASAALLAICFGLVEGQRYSWGTITSFISIPLIIGVGVILLAIFLIVQARTQDREPLVPFSLFRGRNFALMNWVSCAVSIGMMGIFLPFTIYMQSALGFSALKAGLAIAPASLISMFVAPVAGRMTDRIGGKYILTAGLALFAAGMGWAMGIASTTSTWQDFLPGLVVAGLGLGCTFAPMTTTAMRSVQPMMAGAASGMLNTVRQVGAVIGTAAVGALLQNRLATTLPAAASLRSAALPASARGSFVSGFTKAAQSGVSLGAGQGNIKLPAGTPPSLVARISQLGHDVFSLGFVNAMHQTLVLPITVLTLAALSCLAIRRVTTPASPSSNQASPSSNQAGPSSEQAGPSSEQAEPSSDQAVPQPEASQAPA